MSSATFFNTPGSVEEFLAWSGGLSEGMRGRPPSRESPAGFEIIGTEQVMANLQRYIKDVPELVQDELALFAEKILAESLKEVPVDMSTKVIFGKVALKNTGGHLLQSGTVEQAEDDPRALQIGYNTPYAARQHEDLTYHHTRPGAKAKYLEDPAMRIVPQIAPGIVIRIDSYFSQGVPDMSGMSSRRRESLGNLAGRWI